MSKLITILAKLREKVTRRHVRMAAFAVLGLSVGAFVMIVLLNPSNLWFLREYSLTETPEEVTMQIKGDILPEAVPRGLRIPKININTTFERPLGLNADRTIEIPEGYEKVGWYEHGPTPGELGPAVILGHVDSFEGPAVFFSLGQLAPGDRIFIDREDGVTAEFVVTALERYEQKGFPRELVYGDINHAGLRLVTCSGSFDRGEQVYSHNLVVYAALSGTSTSEATGGV